MQQFWPQRSSDADTTKILVTVGSDAFRFRPAPADPFHVTHVFEGAVVLGSVRKPAIDDKGRVTVRLQGVDAPELHYRPTAALKKKQQTAEQRELYLQWNLEYRQYFAETATVAVHELLAKAG